MKKPRTPIALLLIPCAALLACGKDKQDSNGGGDQTRGVAGKITVDDEGTRTVEYAACNYVTVDKSGKLVVKSKEGDEVVVDSKGKVVRADKDFTVVGTEAGEQVYVASKKELVSKDVYVGGDESGDEDEGAGDDDHDDGHHEGHDDDGDEVAICHVPPGNPDNQHTLRVGASSVSAHLGHGDYKGECDGRTLPSKGNSGKNEHSDKGKDKGNSGNKGNKGKGKH